MTLIKELYEWIEFLDGTQKIIGVNRLKLKFKSLVKKDLENIKEWKKSDSEIGLTYKIDIKDVSK